jgi:REP element-mobilizing transposase RayT
MHCASTAKPTTENDFTNHFDNYPKNHFGPQSKNLASIIRGFKIGVTRNARKIKPDFAWQSRYYDHIIRNEKSHNAIRKYIKNNPQKWTNDRFFTMR